MSKKIKVGIASDHAGFDLKTFFLKNAAKELPDVEFHDEGPVSAERCDYPDYAAKVSHKVVSGQYAKGLLICGSGIGMAISANKIAGIRAVNPESEFTARLSREHNDANVICLGARVLAPEYAVEIFRTWLEGLFEGGRHADRISKITGLEKS